MDRELVYDAVLVISSGETEKTEHAKKLISELEQEGFTSILVEPGPELLDYMLERSSTLFVLDFFLGELGTVLDLAENFNQQTRFLVWTDENSVYSCAECMKRGAADYRVMRPNESIASLMIPLMRRSEQQPQGIKTILENELSELIEADIKTCIAKASVHSPFVICIPDPLELEFFTSHLKSRYADQASVVDLNIWQGSLSSLLAQRTGILVLENADYAAVEMKILGKQKYDNKQIWITSTRSDEAQMVISYLDRINLKKLSKEVLGKELKELSSCDFLSEAASVLVEISMFGSKSAQLLINRHKRLQENKKVLRPTPQEILRCARRNLGNLHLCSAELGVSPYVILEVLGE